MRVPCLIALYRDIVSDAPRAIERTALNPDGTAIRIDGKTARRMRGSRDSAAVKITDDADVAMGLTIGEGLESTLAGMMFGHAPAWALGPAAAIGAFPVLAGIEARARRTTVAPTNGQVRSASPVGKPPAKTSIASCLPLAAATSTTRS
jgi:hypothetical protein